MRFRGACARVRLSPGSPSIGRSQPGTATGFGPVMTWFDSTLPSNHAREANEELHRTFNSETVGSNPTARTNFVHVVKRSTPQSAKLLCARSNRAVDSMPVWLVRTSATFVKWTQSVRIRPWAPKFTRRSSLNGKAPASKAGESVTSRCAGSNPRLLRHALVV